MKFHRAFLLLLLTGSAFALPTPKWVKPIDHGKADENLAGHVTPDGIKLEVVADSPTIANPIALVFADDGTPYVLEKGTGKAKDRVKVLRDSKGKGVWDKAEVVLEEEHASGFLIHDGWLYLRAGGAVKRYGLADLGWDKSPKAEVIASGFGGPARQVSGMAIGNDGWLYVSAPEGDHQATGSDGSKATVLRTGGVFRCTPGGAKLHVHSIGYHHPAGGVAFDALGNLFVADEGGRLIHAVEGVDYADERKMPVLIKTGRGEPGGLLIYDETRFPEPYRGLLLLPDADRRLIRAYRIEPSGATFRVTHEFELMKSSDPLFQPVQMTVGPDGAIYVCDRRRASTGENPRGRVWRLTWGGTADEKAIAPRGMDSWAKITKLSDEDLLKTLTGPEPTDRKRARIEAVRRGEKLRPALLKLLADEEQAVPARAVVVGALAALWTDEVADAFIKLLEEREADLRRLAAEGLAGHCKKGDKNAHEALVGALNEGDPAVRRAIYLAIGAIAGDGAADALVNALVFEESSDAYLHDGLLRGIERLGKPGIERLLALSESGDEKKFALVVDAFLTLRTPEAAASIPTLLKYPHITPDQSAALIRSYSNYHLDPPVALDPLIAFVTAKAQKPAVKLAALEVLAAPRVVKGIVTRGESLKSEKLSGWFLNLVTETDPALRKAVVPVVEEVRFTRAAPLLIKLLADEARPPEELPAIARALGTLGNKDAVPVLQKLLKGQASAENARLQREALRSLAALDADAAHEAAPRFLEGRDPVTQADAVRILGSRPSGVKLVARLFLEKRLPAALHPLVVESLRKHAGKDDELTKMVTDVLRGMVAEFSVVGPFGDDLKKEYGPEKEPKLDAAYGRDGLTWQPAGTAPDGLLAFGAFVPARDASCYALTFVYSPEAQKAEMRIGSDGPVRVWVNEKSVYEFTTPRSAVPDMDNVGIVLNKGWNPVLVKVVGGETGGRLYLRFSGGTGVRSARKPEK